MSKDAKVVVVPNGNAETFDNIESRDCAMSGRLKAEADDTAVFSFCDGLVNISCVLTMNNLNNT